MQWGSHWQHGVGRGGGDEPGFEGVGGGDGREGEAGVEGEEDQRRGEEAGRRLYRQDC